VLWTAVHKRLLYFYVGRMFTIDGYRVVASHQDCVWVIEATPSQ
jgi:hypothetical protein